MTARPFISRPGGKTRLLKHLLPLLSSCDHQTYVEVFGGGGALLFAKNRSKIEVFNDIDGELVNAFRMVKEHPESLDTELRWRLNSREAMRQDVDDRTRGTEIQRAARYIHTNMISFGGMGDSFGVVHSQGGGAANSLENRRNLIQACSARLDRVVIEHLPWPQLLDLYDRKGVLFFLDPPYVAKKNACGAAYKDFSQEEADELIARLKTLKGDWILTINDSPENREALKGCTVKSLKTTACIYASDHKFGELIATNRKSEI